MSPARVLLLAGLLLAACRNEPAPPADPANPAEYRPPVDGRLTEEQVRTYLAEAPKSAEYKWVAARVREARTADLTRGMDRKIADSRRRILISLEERRRSVKDPAKQVTLDRQIAEVRRLLQGAPPEVPPAIRENAELVARLEKEKP